MSSRRDSPVKRRHQADDDTEEGELSDTPPAQNGKPLASTPPDAAGFKTMPMPFKTKAKAEKPENNRSHDSAHSRPDESRELRRQHYSPARHERRRKDTYVPEYGARPRSRERYDRYPADYPSHSRWESSRYDDEVRRGDRYAPDDDYSHRRRAPSPVGRSRSPRPAVHPHRLPHRRYSPSPPPRRPDYDDRYYRPRSPPQYYRDYSPPSNPNWNDSYSHPRHYEPPPRSTSPDRYRRPPSPSSSLPPSLPSKPVGVFPPRDESVHPRPSPQKSDIGLPIDHKVQFSVQPRAAFSAVSSKIIAALDPDGSPAPEETGAQFSPLARPNRTSNDQPATFVNGLPPPPSDVPPPVPPPQVKQPLPPYGTRTFVNPPSTPAEPLDHSQPGQKRGANAVPMREAKGTKTMREPEQESAAYGRKFVGIDKLADFELLNKLGEGTFGEVHKARRRTGGQLVALKRILMKNETEGVPITALREIKILKKLNHPSIVTCVSMIVQRSQQSGSDGASIYMVFPFMDHDLSGLLENPAVILSFSQIKLYMKQLCEGVGYLHRNKILHRDLKSANLLINNEGCLQIADFGLARPVANISHSSAQSQLESDEYKTGYTNSVVTRWYRAPELLLGSKKYEGWIDMWGVGCIFAEMFVRKPILPGTSDADQLTRIFDLCGSPDDSNFPGWDKFDPGAAVPTWRPSPRRVRSSLPEDCSSDAVDLLDRLLTLDPKRRITAFESLDHDYFWSSPPPADPKTLPKYDSSHEFNRRRAAQNAPRHAALPPSHMNQGSQFYPSAPPPFQGFPAQQQSRGGGPGRPGPQFGQHQPHRNGYGPPPQGQGQGQPWQSGPPNGRAPQMNRPAPYQSVPPPATLPPLHFVPGRPPPPMSLNPPFNPAGMPPPPQSNPGQPRGWEPSRDRESGARHWEQRDSRNWERDRGGSDRDRDRRDTRPPPRNERREEPPPTQLSYD